MEPTMIFSAVNAVKAISAYLGFIEDSNYAVKALLHQSFKSAKINLEYAKDAMGKNRLNYIEQAKNEFIKALSVEQGTDLVTSYLGLSMCQYLLGDISNARMTLEKIRPVRLSNAERSRAIVMDVAIPDSTSDFLLNHPLWRGIKRAFGGRGRFENGAEEKLEKYKAECLKCLELERLNSKLCRR